jgi:hypothetical protein
MADAVKGYQGPRQFTPENPQVFRRELERLVAELIREQREIVTGVEGRFFPLPKVNAASGETVDATVGFGAYLPVDTTGGGTVRVRLPQRDDRSAGRSCAVIRYSEEGSVMLVPAGAGLVNGEDRPELPELPGVTEVHWSGADNWWTAPCCDAALSSFRFVDVTTTATTANQVIASVDLTTARIRSGVGSATVVAYVSGFDTVAVAGGSLIGHAGIDLAALASWQLNGDATVDSVGGTVGTIDFNVASSTTLQVRVTPAGTDPTIWTTVVQISRAL